MSVNLRDPKPFITYIRRRLRTGELVTSPPSVSTSGIHLVSKNDSEENTTVSIGYEVPVLEHDWVFDCDHPVVRFNTRQTAIGSLVVTGVAYVAWETQNGASGFLYAPGVTPPPSNVVNAVTGELRAQSPLPEREPPRFGNRPLMEFHKGALVMSLRHYKQLRRMVIAPKDNTSLKLGTIKSPTVSMNYCPNQVLYISTVNSALELRQEQFRHSVHATFRITDRPAQETSTINTNNNDNSVQTFFAHL